jgi:hypothetical protein
LKLAHGNANVGNYYIYYSTSLEYILKKFGLHRNVPYVAIYIQAIAVEE